MQPMFQVHDGEVLWMLQALYRVQSLGMHNVVFETSSKILVDVISLRTVKISEFNDNVTSITSILDLNFNSGARFI
jgi:hypothetical protein